MGAKRPKSLLIKKCEIQKNYETFLLILYNLFFKLEIFDKILKSAMSFL